MSLLAKIILGLLVVGVAAFGIAFATSRYLVSRLDGTGRVQTPQNNLLQYASEDGLSFMYPSTYELSSRTEGNGERQWDVLVLLPAGYQAPQGGEGPPAIVVGVYPNPEALGLEQWVRGDNRSNFKLSSDEGLTPTSVGGKPALAYRHSGLYETDAVAVAAGDTVFVFSAGWLDTSDAIRSDFQNLLKTVQFN